MIIRSLRDVHAMPVLAGIGGVVLLVGTLVGQAGHDDYTSGYDLLAVQDSGPSNSMPGMSMPGMHMPGMHMPASDSAPADVGSGSTMKMADGTTMPAAAMPGATMTMPDGSTMAAGAMPGATMTMPDGSAMPASAMPAAPKSTCKARTCTVVFSDKTAGVLDVLGTTAKFVSAKGGVVTLTVGKQKLTLHQNKPRRVGKIQIELTSTSAHSYTVKFTKK